MYFDESRDRELLVDVYTPLVPSREESEPLPVCIYSHGAFSNNRENTSYLRAIAISKLIAGNAWMRYQTISHRNYGDSFVRDQQDLSLLVS